MQKLKRLAKNIVSDLDGFYRNNRLAIIGLLLDPLQINIGKLVPDKFVQNLGRNIELETINRLGNFCGRHPKLF